MAESTITYLILLGAVVLFMSNRVPVALVAIGVSLSLWATGILEPDGPGVSRFALRTGQSGAAAALRARRSSRVRRRRRER